MGRIFTAPVTGKAVIVNNPSTTLTTAYTNATGAGAELRAVNINGVQNNGTINTVASGANEWSYFGSNINPIIAAASTSTYGFGEPYQVQLSDNRVLIFFLPHFQHRAGDQDYFDGNMIHSQILEYQTTGGAKYVAGPIQNHTLPATFFNSNSYSLWSYPSSTASDSLGQPCIRAMALSATKVAVAIRQGSSFWLMRFTITGNTVDHTVTSLDLTLASAFNTTTAWPFSMDTVPGNPNQVVIMGGGVSNSWRVQSYNMPTTGALSNASALQDLGFTYSSTYYFDCSFTRMVKTATGTTVPYIFVGSISPTESRTVIYNYDNAASTWTISGTVQTLQNISSEHNGFLCGCLSTGTNVNAVIVTTLGHGTTGDVTFYRQLTSAGASTARTQISTQHGTTKRLSERYQWGDERVVFTGHNGMLVCYDSAGVATSLITTQESQDAGRWIPHWWPFNSRPLYAVYDPQSYQSDFNVNWHSRTGMTSTTSVGLPTQNGNYLPYGHDYGGGYCWAEQAGCWVIAQGGRMYAVSTTGVVLSEQKLYNLSTVLNYQWRISGVQVLPSGKILGYCEYQIAIHPSTTYSCYTQWSSHSKQSYGFVTDPFTVPTALGQTKLLKEPDGLGFSVMASMTQFVEETTATSRTEMCYVMAVLNTTVMGFGWFNGANNTWSNPVNFGFPLATGRWNTGFRPNFRLIQDTPCSTAYPRGMWRVIGSYQGNSDANYRRLGVTEKYVQGSFGSMNTSNFYIDQTGQTEGWGMTHQTHMGSRSGTQVVTYYDETLQTIRTWSSINGRLNNFRGYYLPSATYPLTGGNLNRWAQVAVSKFGYVVAYQNTTRVDRTATAYVWDTLNPLTFRSSVTATSGSGWFTLYQTGKNSFQLFNGTGSGVNNTYAVYGLPDDIRFYLTLDDNAGNTFYLNNGQSLNPVDIFTGLYRSEVVYQIPNGYSLKLAVDTPNTVQVMLSIQERQ